ncbi:hypothetical protein H1R20_g7129, partial [Candolleomyces eurysporus]
MPATVPTETAGTAILLATLQNLDTPYFLASVVHTAATLTKHKLTIVLFSRFFNVQHQGLTYSETLAVSHTARSSWNDVQKLLTYVYVQATKTAQEMGKVLMDIDILLKGLNDDHLEADLESLVSELGVEVVFRISGDSIATPLPPSIGALRTAYLPAGGHPLSSGSYSMLSQPTSETTTPVLSRTATAKSGDDVTLSSIVEQPPFYPVVALGGTFDHLHPGHKILLSMGAWIASEKLIVGVTSSNLLTKKPNAHLVEPLEVRMQNVRDFLNRFKKGLELYIVELNDVYGPTGWDPNVQALVVSRETISGAKEIATHRAAKDFPPLELFVIDVISATNHNLDHEDAGWLKDMKLSSTFIRAWIAERDAKEEGKLEEAESPSVEGEKN